MEAWRFGFSDPWVQPSGNKFDPTDEDIVAHYLLPRATGVPNPYEHAVIDDDPCSCPPWELLRRHGHGESDQAFFFVPPRDRERNAGRMSRVVSPAAPGGVGGVWRGQKGEDKALVIVRGGDAGGAELTVKFRRYNLTYYRNGDRRSSGWVMHEYHVLHPELRPGAVLARIKITDRAKKKGKREQLLQEEDAVIAKEAALALALAPGPDQPGPSNYTGGYYTDFLNAAVDGGINYINYAGNAVALSDDGAGTSGHAQPGSQIVHQQGGIVGETTNGYYVDDGKIYNGEDINFNQDAGSSGDYFATENKNIYEPVSDTPESEGTKEEEKGS